MILKWILQQNSGNPYVGRELSGLLRQAGFTNIKASAFYQCNESLSSVTKYLALIIEASAKVDQVVQNNWATEESITAMSRALRQLGQHPDGWFALAWCEAVGQKGQIPPIIPIHKKYDTDANHKTYANSHFLNFEF